jgi:hypothetical protein
VFLTQFILANKKVIPVTTLRWENIIVLDLASSIEHPGPVAPNMADYGLIHVKLTLDLVFLTQVYQHSEKM